MSSATDQELLHKLRVSSSANEIAPPSTQPAFRTNYRSLTVHPNDHSRVTAQHTLTLENYGKILESPQYQYENFAPPPLLYSKDKRLLIEIAKAFGLKHGYRIVINKNDNRRVILLCSRHGVNRSRNLKTKKRDITDPESDDRIDGGAAAAINGGQSTFTGSAKTHKCQCPFRAEIQLKQRRKLWVLKPIHMDHNHDEVLPLPLTIDNSTTSNLCLETIDGDRMNDKYTVTNYCTASNHADCFFENGDMGKLLGLDELKTITVHELDGIKMTTTELINNTTIPAGPPNAKPTRASSKAEKEDSDGKDATSKSGNGVTNGRNKKQKISSEVHDADNLNYLSKEFTKVMAKAKAASSDTSFEFAVQIRNTEPRNFLTKFPTFMKHQDDIRFLFDPLEGSDPNFYEFRLVLLLPEMMKILLNEELIDMSNEINDMISAEVIKKAIAIISTECKKLQNPSAADDKEHAQDEDDDVVVDADIANITAVAMKAQQHATSALMKEDAETVAANEANINQNTMFVDPELTK